MGMVDIYVEVCREGVELPEYAHVGDACMDVRAAIDVIIHPQETKVIPTGLKMVIPEGYEIQVRPRSGISLKTPLRLSNSPGTIDSGYKDEIGVIVTNTSIEDNDLYDLTCKANEKGTYMIKKGERIAQIMLNKVPTINFIEVDDVSSIGYNRNGGFGSSGID